MQGFFTKALPVGILFLLVLVQCQQPAAPLRQQSQTFTTGSHFLVTPRWSPTGESLLASGYRGVGLFHITLKSGEVTPLLSTFVGRASWVSPHTVSLHLFPKQASDSEVIQHAHLQIATKNITEIPRPSYEWTDPKSGLLHRILWERDERRISYQWFRQRLQLTVEGKVQFQRDSVWGVVVSPDGRRMAFSEGLLARAELFVWDKGELHKLGRGVHPHWSPDGRSLVYSRPEATDNHTPATKLSTNQLEVKGSDLYVWHEASSRPYAITETSDRMEMEPVFSPTGERIAFADWTTGQIKVISFQIGGQP